MILNDKENLLIVPDRMAIRQVAQGQLKCAIATNYNESLKIRLYG